MFAGLMDKARVVAEKAKIAEGLLAKALGEHQIKVSDTLINGTILLSLDKISAATGKDFKKLEVQSAPDGVTITGRVANKGVRADFVLKVLPLVPVWEEKDHRLRFKILDKSMAIDKSDIYGAIAALGLSIFEILTGKDVFGEKLGEMADEEGAVVLALDGLNERLDGAMRFLELRGIVAGEEGVAVTAKVGAGHVTGTRKSSK